MTSPTAFDPFSHTRLFFMTGLAVALLFILAAFRWDVSLPQRPTPDQETAPDFGDPITLIAPVVVPLPEHPLVMEAPKTPPMIDLSADILEVPDEIPLTARLNFTEPDDTPVPLKGFTGNTVLPEMPSETDDARLAAEVMPEFPGGKEALYKWLSTNIKMPSVAIDLNMSGVVFVDFVIDTNGKVTRVKIRKGTGTVLDEAALEAIQRMPDWTPGMQGGRPVPVFQTLPVRFELR